MLRPVTVGVDGSPESLAAADWAAREALRRGLPLRMVNSWSWELPAEPNSIDAETQRHWAERVLHKAEADISARYPDLAIDTEQIHGQATQTLLAESERAELLALGSRGLGTLAGFLLGSVGLHTAARANCPVVMVRSGGHAEATEGLPDEVVVGVEDLQEPPGEVMEFAFAAAVARVAGLRVVHAWSLPPFFGYAAGAFDESGYTSMRADEAQRLSEALRPWREKYPAVPVTEEVVLGSASDALVEAGSRAGLVVVGRQAHRTALGPRMGLVAHAVLHHAVALVAVVPHS